jgi:predicted O-methyltransferase YrrM
MFSGIDGASLYSFLRDRNPGRYFEVGSGYSTLFAHRARQDGGLRTEITSIDPMPRKEVDAVCDRAIRQRVEDVDLDLFAELEAGDMLLFDGSHRVYSNNDVSVFWLDIVPRIPPGVLVGVHDIVLPEDYPEEHYDRYWSEQYMVAVAVLFGGDRFRLVLPCHYVSVEPALRTQLMVLFDANGLAGINAYGTTFWFELDLPFARGG